MSSTTDSRRLVLFTALGIIAQVLVFAGTAAVMKALEPVDWGAVAWSHELYFDYASRAVAGQVPYRDFVCEYPILTFPLFWIPRLLTADLATYRVLFAVEMFLFDAWAVALIAAHVARAEGIDRVPGRLAWYTMYSASLGPLLFGRFELAPMAIGFAAALWWFSGRPVKGGMAAGLGALVKVFPGVVVLPAFIQEASRLRESRGRGTLAFIATCAVGTAAWFALGGRRVLESIVYQTGRGLEIESIYAGALLLAGKINRTDVPWVYDHKSCHIAAEWGMTLAALSFPLQATALLLVIWRFWRSGMADGVRYAFAAVLAFTATGKVLSPQFLIWLLPYPIVLGGRTGRLARRTFLLCCLSTAFIYPGQGLGRILLHQNSGILLLNLRNILLLALLGLLLIGPESRSDSPSDEARSLVNSN